MSVLHAVSSLLLDEADDLCVPFSASGRRRRTLQVRRDGESSLYPFFDYSA